MSTTGQLTFHTELVGVLPSGLSVPLAPIDFEWFDTFNGLSIPGNPAIAGVGGIFAPGTDLSADPESGTGGITITQIAGVPTSSVPEPSTFILLLTGVGLLFHRKLRHAPDHLSI
jgi:hypothetical protein